VEISIHFFLGDNAQKTIKQIFAARRYKYANPKKPIHHIVLGLTKLHRQASANATAKTIFKMIITDRKNFLNGILFGCEINYL
jgi:hypothetical protein